MKHGPDLDAPTLLHYLEETGVRLWREGSDVVFEAGRELTAEEIRDLRAHKLALLDVLSARELPRNGVAVLPALRAYLLEHDHVSHFPARYLAINIYLWGYLPYEPAEELVAAALEALHLEGEVVA